MIAHRSLSWLVAMIALVPGIVSPVGAADPSPGATRLTIYSQNFALVAERRRLAVPRGGGTIEIPDVPALLDPDSVMLRDPAGGDGFRVLTQSFRAMPIGQDEMLRRSEGKTLRFVTTNPATGRTETVNGILRRAPGGSQAAGHWSAIVEVDGAVRFSLPGEPLFDGLPAEARLRPTLEWEVQSDRAGNRELDLTYATAGLGWDATYTMVLPEKGDRFDLIGRIGVTNRTGRTWRDARVRLLAGDIARAPQALQRQALMERADMKMAAAAPEPGFVSGQAFDEYHLYSLPNPVTVEDGSTTHVMLVRADGVRADRQYLFDGLGLPDYFGMVQNDPSFGTQPGGRVTARIEFANRKDAGLGVPLPAGRVRIERVDDAGHRVLVGEPAIGHTPIDETVRLDLGTAFDLVGERKQTDFRVEEKGRQSEEAFEIRLRNRRTEPVTIRVVERLVRWATWKVLVSSDPFQKKDARTIEFVVPVPPGGEKVVTYRVRYTW